jgi:hypothetical protein
MMEKFRNRQSELFTALSELEGKQNFSLQRGPTGFFVIPIYKDHPITSEEFSRLPKEQKKRLDNMLEKPNSIPEGSCEDR